MATSGLALRTGGLDIVTSRLSDALAKWDRLTTADYRRVKTARDLVAPVKDRYSIPSEQARRDIDSWMKDVGFSSPRP